MVFLFYKGCDLSIIFFVDVDWASSPDDRRSTSGVCTYLAPNSILWPAKKQHNISQSSSEANYLSVVGATSEILCTKSLLSELNHPLTRSPIICYDNLSYVALTANSVRDKVLKKTLTMQHLPSRVQIADVLTKA